MPGYPSKRPPVQLSTLLANHLCPMLLCLISLHTPQFLSSLPPVCAVPSQSGTLKDWDVFHGQGSTEDLGLGLSWHIAKCTNAKRRKKLLPKYVGVPEKMERMGREANFRSWWPTGCEVPNENETRRHSQWGSPLGTSVGKEHDAPAGICRYGLADVLTCAGNVVWTPEKWH